MREYPMKKSKRNNVSTVRQRERDKLIERTCRAIISREAREDVARQLQYLSSQAAQHQAMQNAHAVANNPPRGGITGLGGIFG